MVDGQLMDDGSWELMGIDGNCEANMMFGTV